jgi:hypothetical protein
VTSRQDLLVFPAHLEQGLSAFHVHLEDAHEQKKRRATVALVEYEGMEQGIHHA